ncbi:MAG: heme NO-binding domain-containing protein [Deltaproteobacteria bacterium]|nr:heme NO-binding domain-containing protein [Deltaproteobacteria bacterium]
MKGVVFNIFEEFVRDSFGAQTYEALLDAAGVPPTEPFVGPSTYPDETMTTLVVTASKMLNTEIPVLLRKFGAALFYGLHAKAPGFAEAHHDARSFLLCVEGVVHMEVRKLYPDAYVPTFEYTTPSEDTLGITYRSKRRMCHLMEGLLDGMADYFGTTIQQHQTQCMHQGGETCEFVIQFNAA